MPQAKEVLHFTRDGLLMHAVYEWTQTKHGEHWLKDHRTEAVCQCAEREEDRKSLLGIALADTQQLVLTMIDQTPVYKGG